MVSHSRKKGRCWLLLLLLPSFIVLLWPPFYNSGAPEFFGIPFFYWFQILWIFVTALIIAVAYFGRA